MRFTSRWRCRKSPATRNETSPKAISRCPAVWGAAVPRRAPSVSIFRRTRAYRATLRRSPESTADMGVGPSEWASGSQLCSGTRPTFVP